MSYSHLANLHSVYKNDEVPKVTARFLTKIVHLLHAMLPPKILANAQSTWPGGGVVCKTVGMSKLIEIGN